jgi:putative hydrolase of the HAD superfamily
VVSNFKVPGGVEELLEAHHLKKFFDFVITSINIGWRKPHPEIYRQDLGYADTDLNNIHFIGDDISKDYSTLKELGISAILLDRNNQ